MPTRPLASQLQTLQTTTQSLEKPATFEDTTATSSDPTVLTATTAAGAAAGSYTLRVARTVSTQQLVTGGFADATDAKVGAGTITIGQGSGAKPCPADDARRAERRGPASAAGSSA